MLKLSSQNDYTLCSQYDPSLDLPEIGELAEDADEATIEAHRAAVAQRDLRLKAARDRGGDEWVKLTKPGAHPPTRFNFRQVPGPAVTWWHNEIQRRGLNHQSAVELMFRLALVSVENLGTYKAQIDNEDGIRLLNLDSLATLYALGDGIGRRIVFELGSIVLGKTVQRISPLSSGG